MTENASPLGNGFEELTAADIYHREFKRVLTGGYSVREVDEFLERTGGAFDRLASRLEALEARSQEQRERLDAFRRSEDTLRSALVAAQKFNENILDAARREADALREQARLNKAQADLEAARLPAETAADVERLREQRSRLHTDLLTTLETHRNLLCGLTTAEERLAEEAAEAGPPAPEPEDRSSQWETPE